ncbi:E3 SUMO-protein ligase NSE2-like [Teleopsis dalmanni]|uniref:E3 SUMO-protein ligase NSE2-like n=1 Tax=Teleopsis dalmanni TaxID=139649 RepID=UPI000D32D0AD|nr:E3 SUMO-protein ligase NSE2-like [Teleopsis dalmanni]
MDEKVEADFARVMQCLTETQKLASSLGTEEQKDPRQYLEMCEELCNIRQSYKAKKKIYEAAGKEETLEGYDQALERGLNSLPKKFNAKNTIEYKAFSASMTLDEEEVDKRGEMVVKMGLNKFDPLSKKKMVDPVKSTVCGHHYEKETIIAYIKQLKKDKRSCVCPVSGCMNNKMQLKELQDDPVFKEQIESDEEED